MRAGLRLLPCFAIGGLFIWVHDEVAQTWAPMFRLILISVAILAFVAWWFFHRALKATNQRQWKGRRCLVPIILILGSDSARAGMTSIVLTDLAEARIEVISFFIFLYLLLTLVVKFLWNRLARGITAIPVINFRKALCLMLVSGLMMYVILTMISGARELMTPGAWEKEGISYRLTASGNPRKEQISRLRDSLWEYADNHEGRFPNGRLDPTIPRARWIVPDGDGFYSFLPPEAPGEILVFEPPVTGKKSYVILENGSVEIWSRKAIQQEIKETR